MDNIKNVVIGLLSKRSVVSEPINTDFLNYLEEGYVDSMGLFLFTVELEEIFNITFTDDEINSREFTTVGGLVTIINDKLL